eukprot:6481702-Amphidinium_carterae.2
MQFGQKRLCIVNKAALGSRGCERVGEAVGREGEQRLVISIDDHANEDDGKEHSQEVEGKKVGTGLTV